MSIVDNSDYSNFLKYHFSISGTNLYVLQAIVDGHTKSFVRTGDTDVVVIMIGHMSRFIGLCPGLKLYVMLHTAKEITYYDIKGVTAVSEQFLRVNRS